MKEGWRQKEAERKDRNGRENEKVSRSAGPSRMKYSIKAPLTMEEDELAKVRKWKTRWGDTYPRWPK